MFSWLKKHFIPHEGNDHRPHILRTKSLKVFLITILFIEVVLFVLPTFSHINFKGEMAAVLPAVLTSLTNEERLSDKLPSLVENPVLDHAAQMKAEDMASKGYFAHTSPEGLTPWYWFEKVGYKYEFAGENLAVNFTDSKDVTAAWMASPTHKANIIEENYTEVGTGMAEGIYKGQQAIFVAQIYANPAPVIHLTKNNNITNSKPSVSVKTVAETSTQPNVLGAEIKPETTKETKSITPNIIQTLAASPRNTTNILFLVIFWIIAIALLIYVIIRRRAHHLDLLINGILLLSVICGIFILNRSLSQKMLITDSLNYSASDH